MKKLLFLAMLVLIGVRGWQHIQQSKAENTPVVTSTPATVSSPELLAANTTPVAFQCENKHYCHEMRSCEEARFYLNHCPDPKMDGDHDGVPCEQTLCR
ncbi:excalibur calcium-binding domain-containing protein [Silvimonas iriomotensis]|uniref:Excalibur calcium-binding domain-containing protein n=1 Tax=Silvimonas iriomotensis TaxID=449662 RepID=A0ABQ2PEF4_9NEIS|nr:excalibur calcium-binding domain-containing protein [Silvimonas iriomotensis]GGP23938.1 hypothetical protein GCM10010970_39380 [Silvimonas iriomotensis]